MIRVTTNHTKHTKACIFPFVCFVSFVVHLLGSTNHANAGVERRTTS